VRRVVLSSCLALALALRTVASTAGAADAPPAAPALPADHAAAEGKALLTLLRSAVKEDFRRQAWWLAGRLLEVQPGLDEAETVRGRWAPAELAHGRRPTKSWERQRDAALTKLGDAWAEHAREEQAKGTAVEAVVAALERALVYGTRAADAKGALASAGRVFAGTWGAPPRDAVEKALGDRMESVVWEAEHLDDVLEVRALWPEARVARIGDWRLFTVGDLDATGRLLVLLAEQERDFIVRFGSHAKPPKDPDADTATDLVVAPDPAAYDRLMPLLLFPQGVRPDVRWEGTSGWYGSWQQRIVALERDRDNPWTGAESNLLAWGARALVKRHLAPDASGRLSGRGAWIVDGLAVLYEGFGRSGTTWDLDPARTWHLAAARALEDRWIPWPRLVEMDRAAAEAEGKVDVEVEFGGAKRKGTKVDLVLAQAAALAAGIGRSPSKPGGGWARLAALVEETYKRDRLPDLDKALGGKAKAAFAAAVEAADAASGGG
jgi:hypothetical protein